MDTAKLPLGKLSKAQLTAAYAVLNQITAALAAAVGGDSCNHTAGGGGGGGSVVLVDLSNQFYTLLPSLNPQLLDTTDKVREKAALVEARSPTVLLPLHCHALRRRWTAVFL